MSIKHLGSDVVIEMVVDRGYAQAAVALGTNTSAVHSFVSKLGLRDAVQIARGRSPHRKGRACPKPRRYGTAVVLRSEYAAAASSFTSCWRQCHVCEVWFYIKPSWVKKGRGNCCSWPCAKLKMGQGSVVKNATVIIKAPRKQWHVRIFVAGACCVCGQHFASSKRRGREWHCKECVTETERDQTKAAKARRKALQRGAFKADRVYRKRVFERDKWKCHICGGRIDKSLRAPDRGSATLDHIVPLAFGGEHTMHNIKAAHYGCNSRRGHHAEFQTVLAVAA